MRRIALVLLAVLTPANVRAQDFDFYSHGPYKPDVPRPDSLLGYEPGEFHTNHAGMIRVVEAIAEAASDRVRVFDYGRSTEGRRLVLVVITAPENIAGLSEIRANVRSLRDPVGTDARAAERVATTTPAIGWMNYANDGNETAAFEAAIQVIYQLAAGLDTATAAILENVVTVINPAHNPESHERFVEWYNAFAVGDSTHASLEHDAPWGMSTNNNHYQFDLNRDALALSQRETHALVAAVLAWNPQVFVDHHGQTTQFFMPPPVLPINPSLPEEQVVRWTETFGRATGAAFDRYGWNYFVRDVFDLHYPGYWDSWPALNGAIGMTYETDGGGYKGYRWARDDATVLTFADGIAKHFTASLATLRTAARQRTELLRDYHEFFRSGMNEFAATREGKRFVIVPGDDPERASRLVEILLRDGIQVDVATQPFSTGRAHPYLAGATGRREFPAGSYIIDLAQPQARLVDALLAPDAELDAEFVQRQMEKRAVNARRGSKTARDRYEFYDITAWSLPLSFGVDAYWVERAEPIAATPIRVEFDERARSWRPPALLGTRDLANLPEPLRRGIDGGVRGGPARTAYVFSCARDASLRLAVALMSEGYKVAVAAKPLRAGGASYPRGSLVVRVNRNPDTVHDRIKALAERFGVSVDAVNTGYYEEGPTGVGSNDVITLRSPRVAVVAGEGVSITGFGHAWYVLRREYGLPFTAVRAEQLSDLPLSNYDVVILPPGSRYSRTLGESGASLLLDWVKSGGVLIGVAGAAEYLADPKLEFTTARLVGGGEAEPAEGSRKEPSGDEILPPLQGAESPPLVSPGAGERAPLPVPGAMMRASLDLTHPFTFGFESETIPVLVSGDDFYSPSKEGAAPVAFVGGDSRIAGFVWPDNTEELLDGTAWMIDEPLGRGRVVLFADDPNYRLLWPPLSRLFINVLLIGPTLR